MKIVKVFNNNIVAAISPKLGEIIVMGSGLGFQKKPGDRVNESKIEKVYTIQQTTSPARQEILNIDPVFIELTEAILKHSAAVLNTTFNDAVFLTLADHISFAVQRYKEGTLLPNVMLSETKILYAAKFKVGLWALDLIEKKTGLHLSEDEAGFIALHLVNFSMKNTGNNAANVLKFSNQIIHIVEDSLNVELEEQSLGFARLSIHLKYLAERIFRQEYASFEDTTFTIREFLQEFEGMDRCMNAITTFIQSCYGYMLSPDEQTYLSIHIKNNVALTKK